jgi:hypothetical protein
MQFEDILAFKTHEVTGVELRGTEMLDKEIRRLNQRNKQRVFGGG